MASVTFDLYSSATNVFDDINADTTTTDNTTTTTTKNNNNNIITSDVIDNINMTQEEIQDYLEYLQKEELHVYIPALVFVVLIAVVGLFGNVLVLLVYKSKFPRTPTRVFIMTIAFFDVISNVVCIPGDVYDMFTLWSFSTPSLCHFMRYTMAWTTMASAGILLPLCVTRYLKICLPFGRQVTIRLAKRVSIGLVITATVSSIPYGMLHGLHTRSTPRPGIVGHQCDIDDAYVNTIWPIVNNVLFILLFFGTCIPMIVLYALIGIKAFKHRSVPTKSTVSMKSSDSRGTSPSLTEDSEYKKKTTRRVSAKLARSLSRMSNQNKEQTSIVYYPTLDSEVSQDFNLKDDTESRKQMTKKLGSIIVSKTQRTGSDSYSDEASVGMVRVRTPTPTKTCQKLIPQLMNTIGDDVQQKSANCYHPAWLDSGVSEATVAQSQNGEDDWSDKNEARVMGSLEIEISVAKDNSDKVTNPSGATFKESECSAKSVSKSDCEEFNTGRSLEDNDDKEEDNENCNNKANNESANCKDVNNKTQRRQLNYIETPNSQTEKLVQNWQLDVEIKAGVADKSPTGTKRSKQRAVSRTTIVLFLITFVYILSFVPFLAVKFFLVTQPHKYGSEGKADQISYHFFHRTYLINSAANAVIYSLCDYRFRKEALSLFQRKK